VGTFPLDFFLTAVLSGAFGGLIGSINVARPNVLSLPFVNRKVSLGFLGDLFIGVGASLSVQFAADALFGIHRNQGPLEMVEYMKLIAIGVLAGVAGNRLLAGMSHALLNKLMAEQEQLEDKVEKMEQKNQLIRLGENDLRESRYEAAVSVFQRLIKLDDKLEVAYIYLGKALKRQACTMADLAQRGQLLQQAIDVVSRVIEINHTNDRALYNRGCYKCLAGFAKDKILPDLSRAIEIFEPYKAIARADEDYKSLWADPDFINLLK
jgi:tetratricopeptide (TPR) repeat protein